MIFKKASEYHLESTPPGYTICRVILERGVLYELWCGKDRVSFAGPVLESDTSGRQKAVNGLTASAVRHAKRPVAA